jgi:hypothetical protein
LVLRIKPLPGEPDVTEVEVRKATALCGLRLREHAPNPRATAVLACRVIAVKRSAPRSPNAIAPIAQPNADGAPAAEQRDALVNLGASSLDEADGGVEELFEGELDFTRGPANDLRQFGMVMSVLAEATNAIDVAQVARLGVGRALCHPPKRSPRHVSACRRR